MRRVFTLILPLLIVIGAVIVAQQLVASRPPLKTEQSTPPPPLVSTQQVSRQTLTTTLRSEGMVQSKQELQLTSGVSGRVTWVAPEFLAGTIVQPDQPLVRIDRTDYELALAQAKVALRDAQISLADARSRFSASNPEHPQLRRAQAQVEAANAQLAKARQDLERTEISSPVPAVVETKDVALGQYVNVATPLARLLSTETVEIPLPVPIDDMPLLGGDYRRPVTLYAEAGDRRITWQGRIIRLYQQVDRQTRVAYLVAEVQDPYGLERERATPLRIGQFVHAAIDIEIADAVRVPISALFENRYVFTVDEEQVLHRRPVEIRRREQDTVIVSEGLGEEARVVTSRLDLMTDGMTVRVQEEDRG